MRRLTLICCLAAGLALRCSSGGDSLAGGSSDHGNARTVAGVIVDKSNHPASGAGVLVRPTGYDPLTRAIAADSMSAKTDSAGRYAIVVASPGAYCVSAIDSLTGQRLLHAGIAVGDSDVRLSADTLRDAGAVVLLASPAATGSAAFVYIPGTELFAAADTAGRIRLVVPAATVDVAVCVIAGGSVAADTTLVTQLTIAAGKDTPASTKTVGVIAESDQWQQRHPEWLWCDDFETPQDLSVNYDYAANGLTVDSTDALDGVHSLCQLDTAGQIDGGWIVRVDTAGFPDHLFMRFYQKLPADFAGTGFMISAIRSRQRSGLWPTIYSAGLNVDSSKVYADIYSPASTQANSTGYLAGALSSFTFADARNLGRWVRFEMELRLNTPGSADGALRVWAGDDLVVERTGTDVRGAGVDKIDECGIHCYFNSGSPKVQSRYFDNLVISASRIGAIKTIVFE